MVTDSIQNPLESKRGLDWDYEAKKEMYDSIEAAIGCLIANKDSLTSLALAIENPMNDGTGHDREFHRIGSASSCLGLLERFKHELLHDPF